MHAIHERMPLILAPDASLHLLCCCSPAYRHEDTELL